MSTVQLELRAGSAPDLLSSSNQVVLQRSPLPTRACGRGGTAEMPQLIGQSCHAEPHYKHIGDLIATRLTPLIKLRILGIVDNSSPVFLHLPRTLVFIYSEFKNIKIPKSSFNF